MSSDFLAVPSTTSRARNSDDIDQSSVATSTPSTSSSVMDGFDYMLDNSDPLAFLMNPSSPDNSGDSSAEDSFAGTSTPPSSLGSPSATMLSQSKFEDSAFSFLTQQAFDDGFGLPFGDGNDLAGEVYSMLNPSEFPTDAMAMSMGNTLAPEAYYHNTSNGKPAYMFDFSRADTIPNQQVQQQPSFLQAPRRLSNASSVTSSGASSSSHNQLSPLLSPTVTSPAASTTAVEDRQPQASGNPLIDALTQRARQAVGVSMALPGMGAPQEAPKVPIPRLQHPIPVSTASKRKAPSPPSNTPSPSSDISAPAVQNQRTKTAHTTIERRYRTNINTRIQNLRSAVPALRVLEQKDGNRIGNLNIRGDTVDLVDERGYVDGVKVARKGSKANVLGKAAEYIHVLKRREMRLTREKEGLRSLMSSLVGGPALLREWEEQWVEQFGGPEMDEIDPSEQADYDDDDDDDGEEDDGVANKKRKRSTGDAASKKKDSNKPAPIPTNPTFSVAAPGQPEKRKRGRPRKAPAPSATVGSASDVPQVIQTQGQVPNIMVSNPIDTNMSLNDLLSQAAYANPAADAMVIDQQQRTQHVQPGQYLLAAFAFFSFFNSPIAFYTTRFSRSHESHTHSGVVLDSLVVHDQQGRPAMQVTFNLHDVAQVLHLIVSLLIIVSIAGPWLPFFFQRRISRIIPRLVRPLFNLQHGHSTSASNSNKTKSRRGSTSSDSEDSDEERDDAQARASFTSALLGQGLNAKQEMDLLRSALGLESGVLGLLSSISQFLVNARKPGTRGLETRMMEQKAFQRLAELVALDVEAPFTLRLQTYMYAFKFISTSSASISDLATLALVVQPVWPTKSAFFWEMAVSRLTETSSSIHRTKPFESLVLEDMTVDDAIERCRQLDYDVISSDVDAVSVSAMDSDSDDDGGSRVRVRDLPSGPLAVLAKQIVLEFIRRRAEHTFVRTVMDMDTIGDDGEDESRCRRILAAGKSLDRRTAEVVHLFEMTCIDNGALSSTTSPYLDDDCLSENGEMEATSRNGSDLAEIRSLLHATLLYRELYPSTLLKVQQPSQPPSELQSRRASSSAIMHSPKPTTKTAHNQSSPQPPSISISLTPMPSPPPSPSLESLDASYALSNLRLSLRRGLASSAFDRSDVLEDARDSVVEMLEYEVKPANNRS